MPLWANLLALTTVVATARADKQPTVVLLENHNMAIGGTEFARMRMRCTGPQCVLFGNQPVLVVNRSDGFEVEYQNNLDSPSLVHAHGLTPPASLDGVPYISAPPIAPGRMQLVKFALGAANSGTYFLHSHYAFQESLGLAMPVFVRDPTEFPDTYPRAADVRAATDVVMFLEDVGPSAGRDGYNASLVYATLRSDWLAEAGAFDYDVCMAPGFNTDVHFAHHLCNGRALGDGPDFVRLSLPTGSESSAPYMRVRIVNAASMTNYRVKFGGQPATVVAVDGQPVQPLTQPVNVDGGAVWVSVAQRIDVLVRVPNVTGNYFFTAEAESFGDVGLRSGLVVVVGEPPAAGAYSPHAPAATGEMTASLELQLVTARPLPLGLVARTFVVNLTGDNGFNGINRHGLQLPPLAPVTALVTNPCPLLVEKGLTYCLEFVNFNADSHSMHLHGHSFHVVDIDNVTVNGAVRDTVLVRAGDCHSVKVCFVANNPGTWVLHCHMAYHRAAGMMTTIEYATASNLPPPTCSVVPVVGSCTVVDNPPVYVLSIVGAGAAFVFFLLGLCLGGSHCGRRRGVAQLHAHADEQGLNGFISKTAGADTVQQSTNESSKGLPPAANDFSTHRPPAHAGHVNPNFVQADYLPDADGL